MSQRYQQEQIDFVSSVAAGRYNDEIAELFNAKFGTQVTEGQIKSFKSNHRIQSNVPKRRPMEEAGLFTKAQIEFIKSKVTGVSNQALTNLVNETFGLQVTVKQMNTWKKNHRLSSGLVMRFEKGHIPANKGFQGLYNVGGNKTSYKKGMTPHNYMPVGSERVNGDDYVDIKIAEPNQWRGKHLLVWEYHHGRSVPKGYAVIFGDRDRRNFDPDNLILVSRGQLAIMNRRNLIQQSAELTRSGVLVADIYQKISQRKRK